MSKIQVDAIEQQTACGTTLTAGGGAGKTVVVDATTVTLGRCGGTVALASGASQTGFGRTGTVDWDTTPKTATFTAVSGDGFFCNTTGGVFTCNLPAGSAGSIVSLADYAATWNSNNLTVSPNGSQKIGSINTDVVLNTKGQSVTFVYVDDTQGWINVQDSTSNVRGSAFISATGGTITESGNCKIHTFTGPGTFTVCAISGSCAANNEVSYMVVAGGAAGGTSQPGNTAAAGGAGGFREVKTPLTPYTASPLDGYPSSPNRVTVTATAFPITVGGGGTGTPCQSQKGGSGSNSVFSTITSAGGGGGGSNSNRPGVDGGSGGGGAGGDFNQPGGCGNQPPVGPAQGTNGGNSAPTPGGPDGGSGGGGGATEAGVNGGVPGVTSGRGGAGATTSISASPTAYAGGGGGGSWTSTTKGAASPCGTGGAGGNPAIGPLSNSVAGTTNRGGGGGGAGGDPSGPTGVGANGGSGIVIIRYKYQ